MVWNEISDGQPGLALPAMQNWRHAGRFGTDFVPLETDGTTSTAGDQNLGTAGAPWANLNIATGGAIYIGGTAFEGGGGGSAVEVFEQKSHFEKIGYDYPLSNPQSQNESFMDSSAMVLTLGKTHLNTETTIYLDRDAISISGIDLASLTAWTPVNTGTTATNTTAGQNVDGTSIKYSVTATNTSYFMAHSFTAFSLVDRDLKVWLYPNGVTNLSHALIRLECATTTVYAEFQVPTASLTAATLNSLYLNMDAPDTTTANFNRSAITRVYLGVKGTATPQALEWSWDKIRSVDNRKIKVPVQMVADNGTKQEFINITTATVAGDIYTLETTSTYTHTISSSEVRLKQLDIANGQGVIGSGTTGDAALTGWDIQRTYMNTNTSGDLIISSRWYDESYPVATITNASTTVLSVTTSTVAAGFKSGDVVRLYKWEYVDQDYQSPVNAGVGSNFLDLTLTADGTATSSLLTLVHGNTSNQNLGGDTADKWRGVRVSADDYYRVETATQAQALIKATPTIFRPISSFKFIDTFATALSYSTALNSNQSFSITGGLAVFNFTSTVVTGYAWAYYQGIPSYSNNDTITIYCECQYFGASTYSTGGGGVFIGETPIAGNAGYLGVGISNSSTNGAVPIYIYYNNIAVATLSATSSRNTWYSLEMIYKPGGFIEGRVWLRDSQSRPESPSATYANSLISFSNKKIISMRGFTDNNNVNTQTRTDIDNLKIEVSNAGFIQKSTIPTVSGSKLITATRLTRQDATNQNPIVYQRNAVIV